MVELTVLGTSSMVPTKERNVSGVFLELRGKGILFDCGEGSQRQMNIAGINRNKVNYIFISHWHADHIAGLLGLMQTIQNGGVEEIYLFGPVGSIDHFDHLKRASVFDEKLKVKVREFNCKEPKKIFKCDEFVAEAVNVKHSTPCLAYSIKETDKRKIILSKVKKIGIPEGPLLADLQNGLKIKFDGKTYYPDDLTKVISGKKISYVVDTCFVKGAVDLAKNSDLLLCEATHTEEHIDKAEKYNHMTSKQAAQIASRSDSKALLLCHFSQRYKTTTDLVNEAREIFPETKAAFDLMKVKIK